MIRTSKTQQALALLILRVVLSATLIYGHGWGKLMSWAERSQDFPDPIGLGSAASLALTIGAEVFCAALVLVGLATRIATIPIIITMLVIIAVVHAGDPFGKIELPLLFFAGYTALALTGPGNFSIDASLKKRRATTN